MDGNIIAIIILSLALAIAFGWALRLSGGMGRQERDAGALQEKAKILQELLDKSEAERKEAESICDQALKEKHEAETRTRLALQSVTEMQSRIADREKAKEETLNNTKASVGEIFRKEAEDIYKKNSENLENLTRAVTILKQQSEESKTAITTVWRSLSTSSAIGQFSENSLLNTLKQYGLIEGKDFFYQASFQFGDESRRPDVVIKMPGNNLIVIDSKASQFFFDLAQAEGGEKEAEISGKLKKRMNDHLNSLTSKEYHESVRKGFEKSGIEKINTITTVLFLHSDAAVEKICRIDQQYQQKCINSGVLLMGPTGLAGPLYATSFLIEKEQQNKNQAEIIYELQNLLGSFSVSVKYLEKVNKSLKNAYAHFASFAASLNKNVFPKIRKLQSQGISLPKGKELPESINLYMDGTTIEGEADEVVVPLTIEKK